jgi:hypothetical protein
MTTPLNLYATKVFSEQPTALWALDDTTDYVALISEANQNLSTWSISGGTVGGLFSENPPPSPFRTIDTNRVLETLGNNGTITLTSPVALDETDLNTELGSVAIGAYFITYSRVVNVRIGYQTDSVEVIRETKVPATRDWAFVSQTFNLPDDLTNFRFIIEVSFESTGTPYELAINGINAGQWAEEFHLESPGVFPQPLPSNINIDSEGIEALAYGLEGASGYYLSRNNVLYAKNSGLPLVYGAFNSTVIFPNANRPSLIVPGFGAMNESGKYKTFTVEFWAKIQSNSILPRRIFGPIASSDGIYVEGPFLKIRLGDSVGIHYVGTWDRPMLINLRLKPERASLVINGEEVISLELDAESLPYPEKFDNNNDQDWLGFYAYEDVPIIQVDCVGIYPYEVATIVSKRRWVYGQAVDVPSNIKGLNPANSVFIDGSFSKSAKNYSYPRMGTWRNGVVENLIPETQSLNIPAYTLPDIKFDNQSIPQWYFDLEEAQPSIGSNFISLKPNSNWNNTNGYIAFENLNLLQEETQCFYGVFELTEIAEDKQILFELVNEIRGSRLTISLEKEITDIYDGPTYEDYAISYTLTYKAPNGQTISTLLYKSFGHEVGKIFLVGLHLARLASSFGTLISSFFGAKQNVKVFVGGTPGFSNTYTGKIYRIGFSTRRNLQKIESLFSARGVPTDYENVFDLYGGDSFYDGGFVDTEFWPILLDGGPPEGFEKFQILPHLASYTLIPKIEFDSFKLDIGIDSYWEDYIPLSYFGKYVTDFKSNKYFTLDFLQLNLDYPKLSRFSSNNYDTTGSIVKTYVTFQYLAEGANKTQNAFTNIVPLGRNGVVVPGEEFLFSKYEVLDDTIIYPPQGINFNSLSVNIHIEMSIPGIISNPVKIRSINLSSQALGQSPNRIGTRFGAEVFPYKKDGRYTDYKNVKSFSTTKTSSPYLYLSGKSGIKMRGNFSFSNSDGIALPLNKNIKQFFKIGAFQFAMRYDEDLFPASPVQIFEIEEKNDVIKFYLVSDGTNRKRGHIFAINSSTGQLNQSVIYNIDGRMVKRATLSLKSWSMIGLAFTRPLDLSEFVGAFRVTSPIMFDAISFYQITEEDEAERFAYRKWYAVRSEPDNVLDWEYWRDLDGQPDPSNPGEFLPYTWSEVLFLSESKPTILDPAKIYKQYVGTDRLVFNNDYVLNLNNYRYSVFKDLRWSRQILDSA